MKKTLIITLIIIISLGLISCETVDYTDIFETRSSEIKQLIPDTVNTNFALPIFDDVDVSYDYNGLNLTDEFIYESPFYDQDVTLNFTIRRGNKAGEYSKTIRLLADDSGYNGYKLYIDLPYSVNNVTKEEYTQASVVAIMTKNGVAETEIDTDEAQIRGRGNSTWFTYPKKPFKLRFDENTSLFGMPKAKNYVLLAEYADKSLMRNTVVHKLSSLMGHLSYTLETRFVELYINTVYMGLYVLTEQVEFHKNKLAVESISGIVDTGYLFELDMRLFDQFSELDSTWFLVYGYPYAIKEPDSDDLEYSQVHADYLTDYMVSVENALIAKTGYEELLDVDGWIDFFIIHELTKNVDVGFSSVFYYKEAGGILKPGPLWDFDFAIGNADYIDYGPENFYGMRDYKNRLFKLMMDIPEIRILFRERFNDMFYDVLPEVYDMIPVLSESISALADRNFEKWDIMNIYVWPNPTEVMNENTFLGQASYLETYLHQRSNWMYGVMFEPKYMNGIFD